MKHQAPNLWRHGPGILALAAGIVALSPLWVQQSAAQTAMAQESAPGFDGRTFAGVDLPAVPQDLPLSMAAARTWTWREGNTERILLDRDVRISIGSYTFRAKKAVVWLEPIRIDGADAEQLAVYLQDVSDPGGAVGLSQQGERLLVTAILYRRDPLMKADLRREGRPDDPFLLESEARLSRFLNDLVNPPDGSAQDGPGDISRRDGSLRDTGTTSEWPEWATQDDRGALPPANRIPATYARDGIVSFFSEKIEVVEAPVPGTETENVGTKAMLLTGGVALQYTQVSESSRPGQVVQLTAERGVVFLSVGAQAGLTSYETAEVEGVYLEGDVAVTTGQYTLRGRRVYYDVKQDRAVVLDAVFWTYDEERGMPIYLRAESIRQESLNQWTAKNMTMANVGFAEPHFSIGATTVTLTRKPREDAPPNEPRQDRVFVNADAVKFRFGETPVMYIPGLRGEVKPSILRGVAVGTENGDTVARTEWDLYAIAGVDARPGNQASLLLDGYFDRGVGVGTDWEWRSQESRGNLFAYYIYDNGTDHLPSGDEIDQDDEHRGMIEAEHVWQISNAWTLFLEGSWISDETFVPAFFRSDAETRREFTNSAYLRYLDERSGFTFEVRGSLNDFVTNQYLLQSLGYATEKLPEAAYHRVGDDLFDGLLSYSSESSLAAMRLNMTEPTVSELGLTSVRNARAAFGLLPEQSIGEELRAAGYTEDEVYRADTRHELEMPLRIGQVNIVPFVSGRATAWDTNFDEFSGQTDNDDYRLFGAAGIRMATTIQRVDDSVKSETFDLNRMRHLIEPSATLWTSGSNLDQEDLPIYDDDVESIATGSVVRIGVRNTWQTQRGGAQAWRSVDWLVVNTDYIWSSDDADRESPLGRFIEATPEQSNLGEFINNDAMLLLTDSLAITNNILYNTEESTLARITAGFVIDHGYGFSSLVEYRSLDTPNSTLVDFGARYELTRKYAAILTATYDADESDIQDFGARIERRFPQWTVDFRLDVDNITDEVSAGVALRPVGISSENRSRLFTREAIDRLSTSDTGESRPGADWGPFSGR